jgi:23S rRNA (uracil1939-C5)-methyltransferase
MALQSDISDSDRPFACPHYPTCGGCQTLELDYAEQLRRKQAVIEGLFDDSFVGDLKTRGGRGALPEIRPILPSPSPVGYRHKVMLPFGSNRSQAGLVLADKPTITLGCYARNSHLVVDQQACLVQEPELTRCALAIKAWAQAWGLSVYDETTHSGWLRHAVLRKGYGTGEILAGLVVNGTTPGVEKPLADLGPQLRHVLGERSGALKGVVLNINTARTNVVLGDREERLEGVTHIEENLDGLRFRLRLNSFFQINPLQAPTLFGTATEGLGPGQKVLDLYSGAGTLTLWSARQGADCQGWEENAFAVHSAQEGALLNGLETHTRFECCDVTQRLADLGKKELRDFDALIVDPPRKGLEMPALETIKASGPSRLTYVSCNPNSLRRDILSLSEAYTLESLQPVDMMPQTRHIEVVAQLRRIT